MCLQAKIEKMFTEVAEDNGIPMNEIGCHVFSVDYLGSVALQDKVTSLGGLQQPLRKLYLEYKKNNKSNESMSGRLEISSLGLKVQNGKQHSIVVNSIKTANSTGDMEQLNSFPTIAVWSAVKFVLHEETYAFLPLITDPDNMDKQTLFRAIDQAEKDFISDDHHSPLFAVVMRKTGTNKRLECHGFVCQTSEDAIVIAATLYKSLMAHMKAKEKQPKNRNGITCMSITSSTLNGKEDSSIPVRPPRKKRSTTSSISSERNSLEVRSTLKSIKILKFPLQISDTQPLISKSPKKSVKTKRAPKAPDLDAIVPYEEPSQEEAKPKPSMLGDKWNTLMSNQQKQITAEIKQVISEGSSVALRRVQSIRKRELSKSDSSGDILTKVTIPRSGSFLNAGGLTRYKSKVYKANGQASGGSPLGFHELFNEFRVQEGLHSVDEILGVIIDPEGMSFNDLKPIYKEFLLKLALTLTKDELYLRSKAIMRRQKKKMLKAKKKRSKVMSSKFKKLRSIFTKPLKVKLKKQEKSVSVAVEEEKSQVDAKPPESSISTSSYDTRQFQPKEPALVTRKQSYRRRSSESKLSASRRQRERASTSEDSDFFSVRKPKSKQQQQQHHYQNAMQNRNSSSGYVSCSECSYDSDTCTCVSADKCYCSLGNKDFSRRNHKMNKSSPSSSAEKCSCGTDNTLVYCGCDTDSCTDSNKCYCQKGTIFQQLKQRGFIPSTESTITPPQHRKLCKKYSNTKSTRSLEYMHNPTELYYEKLNNRPRSLAERQRGSIIVDKRRRSCDIPLDYEVYSMKNDSRMVYGRMVSERGHLELQKPASVRSRQSGYGKSKF